MATYTRGTKTVKRNTAKLVEGDTVLTGADGGPASRKTGSEVRTIAGKRAYMVPVNSWTRSASRRYVLTFTDGTESTPVVPIQTWDLVTS